MRPGEKKEIRVTGNIKGFFFESVELRVHIYKVYYSNAALVKILAFFKVIMYTRIRGKYVEWY